MKAQFWLIQLTNHGVKYSRRGAVLHTRAAIEKEVPRLLGDLIRGKRGKGTFPDKATPDLFPAKEKKQDLPGC